MKVYICEDEWYPFYCIFPEDIGFGDTIDIPEEFYLEYTNAYNKMRGFNDKLKEYYLEASSNS